MSTDQNKLESMYASLQLEAKIDYHLSSLENAFRLLRNKVANNMTTSNIWYSTYEMIDEAITKCRLIKSLLTKFRYTGLVIYLTDALRVSNELLLRTESRPALPSHKDNVRILASEISYGIKRILKKYIEEPESNVLYNRAF